MEMEILKKKISTYRGEGGRLTKVSDELIMEILTAWEQWAGPMSGFYSAIGVSQKKMAKILGKGKKLKREGRVVTPSEFTEVTSELLGVSGSSGVITGCGIEVSWENGRIIRFPDVDKLIDFLKKAA